MTASTIRLGDCVAVMAELEPASIDAIVTDPPYGLEFMGKEWDAPWKTAARADSATTVDPASVGGFQDGNGGNPYSRSSIRTDTRRHGGDGLTANRGFQAWTELWAIEALRVLKPGGHLLAFGGTRTYHRLAAGIEDAGFEVRDTLAWMYGSGFPKSHNIGDGLGTALKPAYEPIVLARKPLDGTVAATVAEYGTGALNIDAARIGTDNDLGLVNDDGWTPTPGVNGSARGRWPANVLLDEAAAALLDQQAPDAGGGRFPGHQAPRNGNLYGGGISSGGAGPDGAALELDGTGGASRFFYTAKASTAERNAGLDHANVHPTVKPVELMRYLVRLATPPGGTVLDPFTGSGTTGIAAALENRPFIGIERDPEYHAIATARIEWWTRHAGEGTTTTILNAAQARHAREQAGALNLFDTDPAA